MNKTVLKMALLSLVVILFASCGDGPKGTYVPKNDAAKQSMYVKFIFKGKKVKVIMGAGGFEMPGGYEYTFSRVGDKVSIEMEVMGVSMGGIELNYNKKKDELCLLFGGEAGATLNEYAPVWAKEGSFDPNTLDPESQKNEETTAQETNTQEQFIEKNQEPPTEPEKKVETPKPSPAKEKKTEETVSESKPIPLSPSKPMPSVTKLNDLLNQIAASDDNAIDEIRRVLGNNLRVEGASNISNVQQLITDVSNGSHYNVTKVNTDADGNMVSISVSK